MNNLEPGIHNTGFHAFNHGDFYIENFRVARAYATTQEFRYRSDDHSQAVSYGFHPNRDRDLHIANNVVSQAIAKAMQ